jgi:hypothetical protein
MGGGHEEMGFCKKGTEGEQKRGIGKFLGGDGRGGAGKGLDHVLEMHYLDLGFLFGFFEFLKFELIL